jgi:hypothetical protein
MENDIEENKGSASDLRANIPGISWTVPPKTYAWQRPPKYVNTVDVAKLYIDAFSDQEIADSMLDTIKRKLPLATIAEMLMLSGVGKGSHTIDSGILVTPVIIELLKTLAVINNVDFHMFMEDKVQKQKPVSADIIDEAIKRALSSFKEEKTAASKSGGLMSKGE